MSMTKRQKTFLAIFSIGLVALIVDRTILRPQGGPSAASASSLAGSAESVLPSDNIPALTDEPQSPPLAERLNSLWSGQEADTEQVRDPFALPPSWSDTGGANGTTISDAAAAFVSGHQLTAVVIDGRESYALVNDQFLVPGQGIDGFKLISVGARSAIFEHGGTRATLELVDNVGAEPR
jgi:hypothetical protein